MIEYRLLSSNDFDSLYECFLAAFSDYEVSMQMSPEQFEQRFVRDGVRLEISTGAFDEGRMIGFYINALGVWEGKQTAYDAGTGVVPAYRGRGVASELFAFVVARLKEAGVTQYLLEVLSSNHPAISLYRKLGFVETRELAVLRTSEPVKSGGGIRGVSMRSVEQPQWELFQSFWDRSPSWQNSIAAVERSVPERSIVGAYVGDKCVGYGVAFRPRSILMQLAVSREHRRRGIGSRILTALQGEVSESLKVNNVEGELAFYEANGFKVVLKQFEMMKTL